LKKIVYVITLGTWGGAQAHVYDLIKHENGIGNEVWLVTGRSGRLTQQVSNNFPEVTVVHIPSLHREISPISDIQTVAKLRKLFRHISPDIVHVHSAKGSVVGRLAAIGISPIVYTVHGWAFTVGVKRVRAFIAVIIEKFLQPFTAQYICVSKFDYRLGRAKGLMNIKHPGIVIHNGVQQQAGIKEQVNRSSFRIVMAARFAEPKRQDLLIDAVSKIKEPNIELVLLGEGPQKSSCEQLAQKLGVSEKVFFEGSVSNVQEYYINADIVALISNYEALPISLVEALATSKAIVASNVGGINEIVTDNGLLVENNSAVIANAIEQLYQDKSRLARMNENSVINYENGFKSEQMLKKTQSIYEQIYKEEVPD